MKLHQYQSDIKIGICPLVLNMKNSRWQNRFAIIATCPTLIFTNIFIPSIYQISSINLDSITCRRLKLVISGPTCNFIIFIKLMAIQNTKYVLSHRIPVIIPFACHCTSGSCCPIDDECGNWENVRVIQIGIDMRRQMYDFVIVCILYDHHDITEYKFNNKIFHSVQLNGTTRKRPTVFSRGQKNLEKKRKNSNKARCFFENKILICTRRKI